MKKILLFAAAALVLGQTMTSCSSCSSKKDDVTATETALEPQFVFTKEDTTRVRELVEQFCNAMQNKDIKAALDMIYFVKRDSVVELNPAAKKRQGVALGMIAGKARYELDRITFVNNFDNEAKIDITLFEKEDGDPRPNKTSFYFAPVRRDGQWYLSTKDNMTDTRTDIRVKAEREAKKAAKEAAEVEAAEN